MKEKLFWALTLVNICVFVGYVIANLKNENADLEFLISTYNAETVIQRSQFTDMLHSQSQRSAEEYNRGFQNGRTQAAIGLMNKDALFDYADGYHAALSQMGDVTMRMPNKEDAKLEARLLEELDNDIKKIKSELNEQTQRLP